MQRWAAAKQFCLAACLLVCASLLLSFQGTRAPRKFELVALAPQFWNLIDRDAKLTTVADQFGFTEGPVWDPAGLLYVSDESLNKIFRVYLDGRRETLIELGRSGRQYLTTGISACWIAQAFFAPSSGSTQTESTQSLPIAIKAIASTVPTMS